MDNKLIYGLAGIFLILVVVVLVGKSQGWIGEGEAKEVAMQKVAKRTIIETVAASGKIYPEAEVKISSDVSGEIIELLIEEGDSVNTGQLLARIKPDIYNSAVDRAEAAVNQAKANLANSRARKIQAKAQLDNSQSNFDRNKGLHTQKVISDSEWEQISASHIQADAEFQVAEQTVLGSQYSVESAMATLREARDNLLKTEIYAPRKGIVSMLGVEAGERVVGTLQMAGTEMMRIADLNNMEVRVDVSENDVLRVSLNDTAEIEVDAYLDKKFKGLVTQIAHSANQSDMLTSEQVTNFTVRIKLLHSSYKDLIEGEGHRFPFRPGMSAAVDVFTSRAEDVLAVPIQSVTIREDLFAEEDSSETSASSDDIPEMVFIVEDHKAEIAEVETGIQDDQYIQILSGLDEGQTVVTGPYRAISKTLDKGDAVEKEKKKEKKEEGE